MVLAAILMSPPRPCPDVATEIVPPSVIVKAGVDTLIVPAGPTASAVLKSPLAPPEIVTESLALSVKLPPAPVAAPALLVTIRPPLIKLRSGTLIAMSPARPAPEVLVVTMLPSPEVGELPEISPVSVAAMLTEPALPVPTVNPRSKRGAPLRLPMIDPSSRVREPTLTTISPALPSQRVEVSICAPSLRANTGAVIDTCPPAPGLKLVTVTKGLPTSSEIARNAASTFMRSPVAGATPSAARSDG